MPSRILVTGATGFLGYRLCEVLVEKGYQVRGFGRNPEALSALRRRGVEARVGDLRDAEALRSIVQGVDAVVHAGARSQPWGSKKEFLENNVAPTQRLLKFAHETGTGRFIYLSSPSVGFELRDKTGVVESAALPRPFNHYALSKRLAEEAVLESPLSVILRPQAIFGPGDTALLPRLLRLAQNWGVPELTPGGPLIDVTYVDNVCHAIVLALENPRAHGIFQITNDEPMRLNQLLQTVLEGLGKPWKTRRLPRGGLLAAAGALEVFYSLFLPRREPPLTRYAVGVLAYHRTLDISRAKAELGYAPVVSMADGLAQVIRQQREAHGL